MKGFDYPHWLATAARHTRRRAEAADLLHDALIDAIRADRTDFTAEDNRRWFAGVLRNRAAMTARTAARRRRREIARSDHVTGAGHFEPPSDFLAALPASARSVATLVVSGMTRPEITAALRLTDTSFRQRLTTIRRAWERLPATVRDDSFVLNDPERGNAADAGNLDLGLIRRALLVHVKQLGGIGTHDPDGHLIVLGPQTASSQFDHARQRERKAKEN